MIGTLNKELWMVLIPPVSWALFALGGTQISEKIKGMKWIRRFVLPLFWGVCVYIGMGMSTISLIQAVILTGIGIGVLCMGYGSGKTWTYRFFVGCLYGCVSLPLGASFWNIATALGFFIFFILSNWDYSKEEFTWKICEGIYGLLIGIQIAYLLMGCGFTW